MKKKSINSLFFALKTKTSIKNKVKTILRIVQLIYEYFVNIFIKLRFVN